MWRKRPRQRLTTFISCFMIKFCWYCGNIWVWYCHPRSFWNKRNCESYLDCLYFHRSGFTIIFYARKELCQFWVDYFLVVEVFRTIYSTARNGDNSGSIWANSREKLANIIWVSRCRLCSLKYPIMTINLLLCRLISHYGKHPVGNHI